MRTRLQHLRDRITKARSIGLILLVLTLPVTSLLWASLLGTKEELAEATRQADQWYDIFVSITTDNTVVTSNGFAYFFEPPYKMELPD